MARFHGSTARVYLGSRDVSGDLSDITIAATADTHEATTFASAGVHVFDPGLQGWTADIAAFYDPVALGIGRQLETLLGATGGIISVYEGLANTQGNHGVLLSDGILDKRGQPITVADLIKLTGSFKAAGPAARPGLYGSLLHPLASETGTSSTAAWNNGAASAAGGRANLHATALTGAGGTVTISDSATGSSGWAVIVTFAASTVIGAQTIEIAGAVRQYLRADWVNGANNLTFVVGFARY